jgi:lipopolysaccharide/colanic/teichoic acid biosynthesis glycosyltransferase
MDMPQNNHGLSPKDVLIKRVFDVVVSGFGLLLTWWIIVLAAAAATIDTRQNGFFLQKRIGRGAHPFVVIKIRTMKPIGEVETNVTTSHDARITRLGRFFRKTKIDELPQLVNVFLGQMSLVGPRPDVAGYADKLEGEDRLMLTICPGITGPATLKYRNEEDLLAAQQEPEKYNREIIWPDKVRINCAYIKHWSLYGDVLYIWETIFGKQENR